MAVKRWIELENEYFGPDKRETGWEIFLVIKRCCSYIAKKKSGPAKVVRRQRDVLALTGKSKRDVIQQLEKFISRKDVILKEN